MFRRKIDKPCGSAAHKRDMPAWPHVAHAAFAGTQVVSHSGRLTNRISGFGSASRLQE